MNLKVGENGCLHLSSGPAYLPGSPMDNVVQGTNDMLAKVAVFQNLSSIAHIYHTSSPAAPNNQTPSNVTYRAGKEIVLEPGFTVDQGSTFRAFVQRYLCTGNSDPLTMRRGHDSTAIEMESVDYENDQINPIPIHYIESPKSDADNHPTVAEASYDENYLTDILPLDSPKSSEFKVTPNPTSGRIKVETNKSTEDEMFSIHVYDMKGVLIYFFENVSPDFEINLEGYSKGIYMIQVTSNLGNSITKKIDVIE